MAYAAVISRVSTRPHPNADRLQLATVAGTQIIIGLDVEDQTLGIFFPSDGQISNAYAEANDLVGYVEDGVKKGGFFAANRRVRAQSFRGQRSNGFWSPLSSLAFTGADLSTLSEGDEITELNGVAICNKYYTPATIRAQGQGGGKSRSRKETEAFPRHFDTTQFRTGAQYIPPGSLISITEKEHGTSGRFGYVEDTVERKLGWIERFRRFIAGYGFSRAAQETEYRHLMGSRNVILEPGPRQKKDPRPVDNRSFAGDPYRVNVVEPLVDGLIPGEMIYFEIVGYQYGDTPIMDSHDTTSLSDKTLRKTYGDHMVYAYGCQPGEHKMRVYRITRALQGGGHMDLTWPAVQQRCSELGLDPVSELAEPFVYTGDLSHLTELANQFSEGASTLDPSHIREGCVVRADTPHGTLHLLKHKSFDFGLLEGYLKESDDYVDTEEAS